MLSESQQNMRHYIRSANNIILNYKTSNQFANNTIILRDLINEMTSFGIGINLTPREVGICSLIFFATRLMNKYENISPNIDILNDIIDNETNNEELLCCICFVNKINVRLNCGHVKCCSSCTINIINDNSKCPICREIITKVQKVYI